jgi:hypothetical protein
MCRFQIPGQVIAKYIPTFIEYPPMLAGASFNVSDLKAKVEAAARTRTLTRALSVSKLAALVCKP